MTSDDIGAAGLGTRFRRLTDWFVTSEGAGVHTAQVGTTAERAVDLLHALAFHLDPAVDVVVDSVREQQAWKGEFLALPDVRDMIGRLKLSLATYGGVEISLFTPDDQLSLTPELSLVVFSRTDRWFYLLEGMGLEERDAIPPPTWRPTRHRLAPAPELEAALHVAVERLALVPAESSYLSARRGS